VPFCRQTPFTLKALRAKDYSENPQTLGEHLKKRRRQLGLLQRETAEMLGVSTDTRLIRPGVPVRYTWAEQGRVRVVS
jgi:hypothetical protein